MLVSVRFGAAHLPPAKHHCIGMQVTAAPLPMFKFVNAASQAETPNSLWGRARGMIDYLTGSFFPRFVSGVFRLPSPRNAQKRDKKTPRKNRFLKNFCLVTKIIDCFVKTFHFCNFF
jgi:hypothetical protein